MLAAIPVEATDVNCQDVLELVLPVTVPPRTVWPVFGFSVKVPAELTAKRITSSRPFGGEGGAIMEDVVSVVVGAMITVLTFEPIVPIAPLAVGAKVPFVLMNDGSANPLPNDETLLSAA